MPRNVRLAAAAASEALRGALRAATFRSMLAKKQAEQVEQNAREQAEAAEAAEGRQDSASEKVCVICRRTLTARDRVYAGEGRDDVCKRCDTYGRRRALKGFYANLPQDAQKGSQGGAAGKAPDRPPNPFFGENRQKRRVAARDASHQARAERVAATARLRQSGARVPPARGAASVPFVKVTQDQKRRARAALEAELRQEPVEKLPDHLRPKTPRAALARTYGRQLQSTRKRKRAVRRTTQRQPAPAAAGRKAA